jgi:hypothetical protein
MVEFPRCAVCRVSIEVGQNVRYREDGRVSHSECPPLSCPICERSIESWQPIRRNPEGRPVHGNCWTGLLRRQEKGTPGATRPM